MSWEPTPFTLAIHSSHQPRSISTELAQKSHGILFVDDESIEIDVIVLNMELFLGLYWIAADLDMFNRVNVRMSIIK